MIDNFNAKVEKSAAVFSVYSSLDAFLQK